MILLTIPCNVQLTWKIALSYKMPFSVLAQVEKFKNTRIYISYAIHFTKKGSNQ